MRNEVRIIDVKTGLVKEVIKNDDPRFTEFSKKHAWRHFITKQDVDDELERYQNLELDSSDMLNNRR